MGVSKTAQARGMSWGEGYTSESPACARQAKTREGKFGLEKGEREERGGLHSMGQQAQTFFETSAIVTYICISICIITFICSSFLLDIPH